MRVGLGEIAVAVVLGLAYAPPPRREVKVPAGPLGNVDAMPPAPPVEVDADINKLEYQRYLQEVVGILESHPEFKSKLEKMDPEDIKSGDIANHLDTLPTDVRTLLDEAKRREVDRLRQLVQRQMELSGPENIKIPIHIDHDDLEKFDKEDLRKLIKETTADLEKLDKVRRKSFKEYEMKKQAEKDHRRAQMTPEEREKDIASEKEAEKRHNDHEKMKHPGSKDQLEDVWEEQDGMDPNTFDPRTFFSLHDMNGDGFLDETEVEALFNKELDKSYNASNPDDDMRERDEEMARMREHVFGEVDKDKDKMISLDEFMKASEAPDFDNNEEWGGIDDSKEFNDDELKAFEEEYAKQQGWGDHPYDPITPPMPDIQVEAHPAPGQVPPQVVQAKNQPAPPPPVNNQPHQPPPPPAQQGQGPPQPHVDPNPRAQVPDSGPQIRA